MDWKKFLADEIDATYQVTQDLIDLVDEDRLEWVPPSGSNWMTVGQLLHHLTDACGAAMRMFVTGEWGMPPADGLPAVKSPAEAKELLAEDKTLALAMLAQCTEEQLANKQVTAPWNPTPMTLGHRLLQMVQHLGQHKSQLFYYLKLQGKPVHTGHLWGM